MVHKSHPQTAAPSRGFSRGRSSDLSMHHTPSHSPPARLASADSTGVSDDDTTPDTPLSPYKYAGKRGRGRGHSEGGEGTQ